MKVLCRKIISPTGNDLGIKSSWLTVGNEYVVLAMSYSEKYGYNIYIETDNYNQPGFFGLTGFEFINQKIPSCWITKITSINGNKFIRMFSNNWDYESFWEDISEDEPHAMQLFHQEAQKIYEEEEQHAASKNK